MSGAFSSTAFSTSAFSNGAFLFGSPTPPPDIVPLPHQGNAVGSGHSSKPTFTDIERWTRRGNARRVAALPIEGRRKVIPALARAQERLEPSVKQEVRARAVIERRALTVTAGVALRPYRVAAMGIPRSDSVSAVASARQTERQDVADILAVIELLDEIDQED